MKHLKFLNYKLKELFWDDLFEIAVLLMIFAAAFEIHYWNRFYPNVFIGNTDVGGKSYNEVLKEFFDSREDLAEKGLTLVFFRNGATKEINIPAASYGLTPDAVVEYYSLGEMEAVVKEAFDFGRSGPIWKRFAEQTSLIFGQKSAEFQISFQEEAVKSLLDRELVNFYQKPEAAKFVFKNSKLSIEAEQAGERASDNGNKIIRLIYKSLSDLNSEPLFFSFRPVLPEVTEEKLQPFLPLATDIAKNLRIILTYENYKWNVSGKKLVEWLTLSPNKSLIIADEKLDEFLVKNIKPLLYNPSENSRFEIQNGKLSEIIKGKSGNSIDKIKIKEKLEAAINSISGSRVLEIAVPIVKENPKITKETINKYGIETLITSVKTSFNGSTVSRKHNIKTGVSKLNGILIAPGAEFSAVEAIGLTTEEAGFLKEYVIKGDRSVKEVGGGLCQIATTLFRLAINAGLPIIERSNHLYVVGYYGPGLDATIYGPQKDLKFINDTGRYLLLQAKVIGDEVWMEFYGNKDSRKISISEPKIKDRIPPPEPKYVFSPELKPGEEKCTEQARFGMTAEVNYRVEYASGKTNEQIFKSVYRPWQKVCLVGADKKDPNLFTNL